MAGITLSTLHKVIIYMHIVIFVFKTSLDLKMLFINLCNLFLDI